MRTRRWPQPDVVRLSERRWKLRQAYTFVDLKLGRTIVIPAGFIFDLSSVPRALWVAIAPSDLGDIAALLHDWIYRHKGAIPGCEPYTRAEADDLFRRVMVHDNVQPWKRRAAYTAVRVFGRFGAWGGSPAVIEPVTPEELLEVV